MCIRDRSEVVRAKKKLDFSNTETACHNPPSFSLPKLHKHWFGQEPKMSHGAEWDCLALMRVCAFKGQAFINYAKLNATPLSKVGKMW